MRLSPAVIAVFLALPHAGMAQNSSASSWTGSYSFSSPTNRLANTSQADMIKRAEEGYYETFGANSTTYNNTTVYDSSVGDVYVGDGSNADIEYRTGENSGNDSYTVGSVNNSTTEINVDGTGNNVDVNNSSSSQGCQNGSINIGSSSGFDISGGNSSVGGASGC